MKDLNVLAVIISAITCAVALFQSVYATRHPTKGPGMGIIRSLLTSAALTLIICGSGAAFTLSPWYAVAPAFGIVCGLVSHRLSKYDWNPDERFLVDRFFALDVAAQKMILQAIEENRRVLVNNGVEPQVSLDGKIPFKVNPSVVREIAAQGWLALYDSVKQSIGRGLDSRIIQLDLYTVPDKSRKLAAILKERGLSIQEDPPAETKETPPEK